MCPYEDYGSLADLNDHTTARAMVLCHSMAIRSYTSIFIWIYDQFRYNVSVVTTIDIPVEDVDPADWNRQNPVMAVEETSNVTVLNINVWCKPSEPSGLSR